MTSYRKRTHDVTITDFAKNLWSITKYTKDLKERETQYDQLCQGLVMGGKSHPKWILEREVSERPAQLKSDYSSKEELYADFEQNVPWDEFLEIIIPLDAEPTPWAAA
jgi:hypothetical protein